MKIKIAEAAMAARTLRVDLKNVDETLGDKIVDLFMELLPHALKYDNALSELQKDAQGKSEEEVKDLVSAKAFEKIANTEIDIEASLTKDEIKGLTKKKIISMGDMAALYNLLVAKE